jgi:limonene 1,2-monooxygenase
MPQVTVRGVSINYARLLLSANRDAFMCFEIGVAAIASPSGPRLAGRYGVGLLSVGATIQESFDALHLHWDVMEERAAEFGTLDRSKWRLVGPIHLADERVAWVNETGLGVIGTPDEAIQPVSAV